MRKFFTLVLAALATAGSAEAAKTKAAQRDNINTWQHIHRTPVADAQQNFALPPVAYASHVIYGWQGKMDIATLRRDLDSICHQGFRAIIFEAGYNLPYEYLSDDWFRAIATGVQEAKKRGMKVWIIDEGKYPSGFAGGKFTRERPDLRMQALVLRDSAAVPEFRTGQTRAVNDPTGAKTTANSICDYLNPAAVRQFIDWTHEQYKKFLGPELGTTVMGFRGDEPDFAYTPWTPNMVQEFSSRKGYDPTPHLASLFARIPTEKQKQFRADYWDVWSELFAVNFFKQQADWCAANGVAHITHLNNEHNMPVCIRAEGDWFRDMSKVQIPGVDAIWNQIWPGTVNDFPKLASSVGHVYGKPRAFSESFAAYRTPPDIRQAKYVVDYQIVRGINFFEFMFWMAGSKVRGYLTDPGMPALNAYTNRATYLLAQGVPGARVAMYYPTSTMWLGNNAVFAHVQKLTATLLEHQVNFDYVNDDAFAEALTVGQGYLENLSGQRYSTLIIPSADVLSDTAWSKLREFATRGGRVLIWGSKPTMLVGRTFTEPRCFPVEFDGYLHEPSGEWTPTVAAAMPAPEMKIQRQPSPRRVGAEPAPKPATDFIRYTRKVLPDADVYFLFNEGEQPCRFTAEFDRVGIVQSWDANTGKITDVPFRTSDGRTVVALDMPAWDSRIIVIRRSSKQHDITAYGAVGDGTTVNTAAIQRAIDSAAASGGGTVVVPAGTFASGALFFKRGVDLNVCKGATLVSTVNPADFPVIPTRFEGIERPWRCAFLNFTGCDGVRVWGAGTVDGRGVAWKSFPFRDGGRPRLICFTRCAGGSITGLQLRDQASWCVHVLYTSGFSIADLDIRAEHTIPSSDGLDIDSSDDIDIRRVFIDVNDDCISIKSGKDEDGRRVARASERIVVDSCHLAYGHGGVALGSEISGNIRNVVVRNCRIDGDNWGPIRFKSQPSRGGVVENITFENIALNNTRSMLDVNMEWRMVPPIAAPFKPLTQLRNIRIINVTGTVKSVGALNGFADAPFAADVFHFERCRIKAAKGLVRTNADAVSLEGLVVEMEK